MPWPFEDRDCVWQSLDYMHAEARFAACLGRSTEHRQAPRRRGFVRVSMRQSGSLLEAVEGSGQHLTRVTFLAQGDAGGSVPSWAVNQASSNQALRVARVKEHFAARRKH
mmetsp:Transcript_50415/g.122951  ORF Transcript_50415/g.122951 Transcript_50415/m.122951 type:complete len:110 (-) Transcript_50415:37-366(-)